MISNKKALYLAIMSFQMEILRNKKVFNYDEMKDFIEERYQEYKGEHNGS